MSLYSLLIRIFVTFRLGRKSLDFHLTIKSKAESSFQSYSECRAYQWPSKRLSTLPVLPVFRFMSFDCMIWSQYHTKFSKSFIEQKKYFSIETFDLLKIR